MDEVDWRILDELGENCRISYRELAKRVGLSTTATMNRVVAMEDDGTIALYVVLPSSAMIGANGYTALIHTDASEDSEEFMKAIVALPETIIVGELATTKGRSYVTTGQWIGAQRLQEIGRFFREPEAVEEVELHPIRRTLVSKGSKMELTKHHLLVLKALNINARKPINEISEETGLTRRRVRNILKSLMESGAFRFIIRMNLTTKRMTEVVVRIHYNDYESSLHWYEELRQSGDLGSLFDMFYSITDPIAFAWFFVDDVRGVNRLSKEIAKESFVVSSTPLVLHSMKKSPWLAQIKLEEMISELDL
ncbi:MAG: AsnC family transcriptional regulator [Candidatus Thorarchaeota archaeon]